MSIPFGRFTGPAMILALLTLGSACSPDAPAVDPALPLYDDLGDYHFSISTPVPLTQEYFDQGMRLYFAFNHAEAIRAFRVAQRLDPACAICWWGEALAWGPNINLPMDEPSALAAYAASVEAQNRRHQAAAMEQALIDALAVRYAAEAPADRAHLDQAYAEAMGEAARRFSGNLDIGVLYAESLMDLRPWDYWTAEGTPQPGIEVALSYLERALSEDERHPGACHFYIHAVEAVFPERAVPCAERLAELMPGAGHLVHMPGHIYIRVGRYLDAVTTNEHAVHADETYIQDQRPDIGMYTAGYYPHNYDFMAFAAMMIGRSELAISAARQVTALLPPELFGSPGMDFLQHWSARPLQMQVRFGRWQDILETDAPPGDRPHALALWHYARGRALLAEGDLTNAGAALQQLQGLASRPELADLRMEFNQSSDLLAIAERVLAGWLAASAGNFDGAVTALEEAVSLENNLLYGEPPEWSVPTRQDLGAILLRAGRASEAEQAFSADLAKFPENGWSLYGLQQALLLQGRATEAAQVEADLRRVWSEADVDLGTVF